MEKKKLIWRSLVPALVARCRNGLQNIIEKKEKNYSFVDETDNEKNNADEDNGQIINAWKKKLLLPARWRKKIIIIITRLIMDDFFFQSRSLEMINEEKIWKKKWKKLQKKEWTTKVYGSVGMSKKIYIGSLKKKKTYRHRISASKKKNKTGMKYGCPASNDIYIYTQFFSLSSCNNYV